MGTGSRRRIGKRRTLAASFAWVALAVLVAGCAGEDRGIALHPAHGQVLVAGKPEAGVQVRLHPVGRLEDMDAPRPFAGTEADGSFGLGTFEAGDGAPVGEYLVTFFWPGEAQGPAAPPDRLGGKFTNITQPPARITIREGDNHLEPFRLDPTAIKLPIGASRGGP